MYKFFLTAIAAVFALSLSAGLSIERNGTVSGGGLKVNLVCVNKKWAWRDNRKFQDVKVKKENGTTLLTAGVFMGGSDIAVTQKAVKEQNNWYALDGKFSFKPAQDMARCGYSIRFDIMNCEVEIDGVKPKLLNSKNKIVYHKPSKKVFIRGEGSEELEIEVPGNVVMVEKSGGEKREAQLTIVFPESSGKITECAGNIRIRANKLKFTTVDVSKYVNRNLADSKENPGWTNQGYGHDMSCFPGKAMSYGGVPFVPVPGKSVTVGGERRLGTVRSLTVKLENNNARAVHLLHNSAWTSGEFAKLSVKFKNGKTQEFVLNSLRDGGDWVQDTSRANGLNVWQGVGANGGPRTMFLSVFPLKYSSPTELAFTALTKNIYWAINAITLGNKARIIPNQVAVLRVAKHGKEWQRLKFDNTTVKGSALDFSFLLDAPAGKYGRALPAPDGTLRFANGKRLKLFGTNICHTMSTLESKEYIDAIADQLASLGYNSARIHFASEGQVYGKGKDIDKLDPEKLDKLDYLFYALKKRGIYYTTDFWGGKPVDLGGVNPNIAFSFDKELRKEWKNNAKLIFTRKNAYTGMSLVEDPAFVFSNLMNEDNVTVHWNNSRETRELVLKYFKKYIAENKLKNTSAGPENPEFTYFLIKSQMDAHADMIDFVKNELKCDVPLTSLNFHNEAYLIPMREQFGLVDTHNYISHPIFSGRPWYSPRFYHIECSTWDMASLARRMFIRRMFGKPFVVTEYNVCKPNFYRSECAPMMGSYSALQDWDGIYRFCFSHSRRRVQKCMPAIDDFETVADPVQQLGERLTAVMFLRQDVKAAPERYVYSYGRNTVKEGGSYYYPMDMAYLGLIQQVGCVVKENGVPDGMKGISGSDFKQAGKDAGAWKSAKAGRAASATGEILLDAGKKIFKTITPKSESLLVESGSLAGKILEVKGVNVFQNVALISCDGKALAESRRMLLLHLTDITNTDSHVEFEGTRARTLKLGVLPLLVRNAKTKITLNIPADGVTVYALALDGTRLGKVKYKTSGNKLSFTADTAMYKEGVMAYEIIR